MKKIRTITVFNAETIAAGGTSSSAAIDLDNLNAAGFFSLQVTLTGLGTAKIEYLLSNDGTNYLEPSSAADIVLAHTVASGPAGDGKDIYSFSSEIAKNLKIKITETGAANTITVTATLAVQSDH